jgi:membrane-associated HD superfamily phosphohydrolase
MIFACHPISNAWKYANTANGTCINRLAAAYTYGGLNVIYDIIVVVLPIPKLMRLDVSTRQKAGILSCFLVGFIATGCSIVRLFTLNGLTTARNITWDFVPAGFWSIVSLAMMSLRAGNDLLTASRLRSTAV